MPGYRYSSKMGNAITWKKRNLFHQIKECVGFSGNAVPPSVTVPDFEEKGLPNDLVVGPSPQRLKVKKRRMRPKVNSMVFRRSLEVDSNINSNLWVISRQRTLRKAIRRTGGARVFPATAVTRLNRPGSVGASAGAKLSRQRSCRTTTGTTLNKTTSTSATSAKLDRTLFASICAKRAVGATGVKSTDSVTGATSSGAINGATSAASGAKPKIGYRVVRNHRSKSRKRYRCRSKTSRNSGSYLHHITFQQRTNSVDFDPSNSDDSLSDWNETWDLDSEHSERSKHDYLLLNCREFLGSQGTASNRLHCGPFSNSWHGSTMSSSLMSHATRVGPRSRVARTRSLDDLVDEDGYIILCDSDILSDSVSYMMASFLSPEGHYLTKNVALSHASEVSLVRAPGAQGFSMNLMTYLPIFQKRFSKTVPGHRSSSLLDLNNAIAAKFQQVDLF